jgi:2-polyprenyl-3-methyl-5-hydroxy-6-metoxy-1,4-benzoquinol methylase
MTDFSEQHVYTRSLDPNSQDSLAKIARLIKPSSQVLDLGAGPGVLGRYLSENLACTVDGVEYNPLAAELAAPYYRHLEIANLEQISLSGLFQGVKYDYIVCADILEHLRDPGRLVEQLIDLLKPEGRLLISIPNVAYAGLIADLLADEFSYRPEGLLDETHLRFFTRTSLLAFLAEHGFVVCSQDSTVMDLLGSDEFRARYLDAFPPALVRGLLARPDALTYQFIIEAKALEEGEFQEPPKIPAASPELRFACQLFWRWENNEYSERNSSFAFGCIGKDKQTLSFPIPPSLQNIAALRLDLSDRPGLLRLFAIGLYDNEGRLCWTWDGRRSSLESMPSRQIVFADLLPGSQGVTVLLTGEDPGLTLPIPVELLMGLGKGGELRLQVSWPLSIDYLSLVQHCVPREYARGLESRNAVLESHNTALEMRQTDLESRNAALEARQAKLESQNTELRDQLNVLSTHLHEREQLFVTQAEEVERLHHILNDIQSSTLWRWSRHYVNGVTWLRQKLKAVLS